MILNRLLEFCYLILSLDFHVININLKKSLIVFEKRNNCTQFTQALNVNIAYESILIYDEIINIEPRLILSGFQ